MPKKPVPVGYVHCPKCGGDGKYIIFNCIKCGGTGVVKAQK